MQLTDLYLDIENAKALKRIFRRLHIQKIARLTVLSVITNFEHPGVFIADGNSRLSQLLSLLTQDYQLALRQLTLLNVWQTGYSSDQTWMSPAFNIEADFDLQELCLGTAKKIDNEAVDYDLCSSSGGYSIINNGSFSHCTLLLNTFHFGTVLQRLRIDQVDFHDNLLFNLFKEPWYFHLKILMLYPLSQANCVRHPLLLGDEATEIKIDRLTRDIGKNLASHCVRVIVLGMHHVWVERTKYAG